MQLRLLLQQATDLLTPHTDSPRLDAELLLAETLQVPRSWLFAYPEHEIDSAHEAQFLHQCEQRATGVPIAYLLETREFWSLSFKVTRDVLIPRPETELLVSLVLATLPAHEHCRIADLGTGTGAIALSLAHERPDWHIIATDLSAQALALAAENAQRLQISNVIFRPGDGCRALENQPPFHAIVSNPPYLSADDPHLQGEIRFEPREALVAGPTGLETLQQIIATAKNHLLPGGFLMLEHGYDQGPAVHTMLIAAGYQNIEAHRDIGGHHRVTVALMFP